MIIKSTFSYYVKYSIIEYEYVHIKYHTFEAKTEYRLSYFFCSTTIISYLHIQFDVLTQSRRKIITKLQIHSFNFKELI